MKCPDFCCCHVRQRRGDAVEHALDVDVDHPVPLVDLQPLEQRLRHEARVVDHHVDPSVVLNRRVHQPLHLIRPVTSVDDRERLRRRCRSVRPPATSVRSARRAPRTTLAPCADRWRAAASPSPLLAPVMTTTLSTVRSGRYCPYCSSRDLLQPVDGFAVEPLLNGDVRHRGGRRRAVPVLFARREPDDVAGANLLDRAAPSLRQSAAGGDDERLARADACATRSGRRARTSRARRRRAQDRAP